MLYPPAIGQTIMKRNQ